MPLFMNKPLTTQASLLVACCTVLLLVGGDVVAASKNCGFTVSWTGAAGGNTSLAEQLEYSIGAERLANHLDSRDSSIGRSFSNRAHYPQGWIARLACRVRQL